MLGALGVVLLSPGNQYRQSKVGAPMSPVKAIVQSIAECLETTGGWFSPQLAAITVLFVPLLWNPLKNCGSKFRYPFWFSFFSFGVLAASFVPAIYATGVEGGRVDRVISSLYMLYVFLCMANMLYWTGWLSQRVGAKEGIATAGWKPAWRVGQLALCAGLLIWGIFSFAVTTSPPIAATLSLLNGDAAAYHTELSQRQEALCAATTDEEQRQVIHPVSAQPTLLFTDRAELCSTRTLQSFRARKYAGEYGAGNIPEEVWKADVMMDMGEE